MPKVDFLQTALGARSCTELFAKSPEVLRFGKGRLTARVKALQQLNEASKLAYAMTLTETRFERRFLSRLHKGLEQGENSQSWAPG